MFVKVYTPVSRSSQVQKTTFHAQPNSRKKEKKPCAKTGFRIGRLGKGAICEISHLAKSQVWK